MVDLNNHGEGRKEVWEDKLLTYEQASEMLTVPKGTLYAWVHAKRIPHIRLGPRLVKFRQSDLESWLAAHRVAVGAK
jgi:excisionase family DNA binding protein